MASRPRGMRMDRKSQREIRLTAKKMASGPRGMRIVRKKWRQSTKTVSVSEGTVN